MNATYGKKRLFRWGAGVTLAGFLVGGGIALAATSGGSTAAGAGTQTTQEASTLNSVLSTAASTTAPAPRVRWALGRLRALGGVEGQATFHNKTGYHTLAFERGTVQSATGSQVVIKSPDGTTWTWQIVKDTVVRQNGKKTTTSALKAGETVFAAGPVVGGAKDIRLIVVRTGSESAQTSLS